MSVLVLAEHNNQSLKEATKKAVTAALKKLRNLLKELVVAR